MKAATSSTHPNEDAIIRLIGVVLLEANDRWQLQHRYMQIEGMVANSPLTDDRMIRVAPQAA